MKRHHCLLITGHWLLVTGYCSLCVGQDANTFAGKLKAAKKPAEGAEWKLHKDVAGKFSLLLPILFRARSAPDDEKATVLYATAGGSLKDYRLVKVVADQAAIPEPTDANLSAFATSYLDNQIAARLKDAKIDERAVLTIDGKKAFLVVFDGTTMGGFRSSVVAIVVKVGGTTYHLSASCLEENLDKYAEAFAQIFSSWKFAN